MKTSIRIITIQQMYIRNEIIYKIILCFLLCGHRKILSHFLGTVSVLNKLPVKVLEGYFTHYAGKL